MRRVICLLLLLLVFVGCKEEKMSYTWANSTIFTTPYSIYEGHSLYATTSDDLFVVFADYASWNIYFSKSNDRGTTWSTPVLIDSNRGIIHSDYSIWVSPDKEIVYVVYQSYFDYKIRFSRSTDGGVTFSFPVNVDSSYYEIYGMTVRAYDDGQYAYIGYQAKTVRPDTMTVRIAYSDDYGQTWTPKTVRASYPIPAGEYDVAVNVLSASTVYIATGSMHPVNGWEFSFSKTSDSGDSWSHTTIDDRSGTYALGYNQSMYVKDSNNIYISYTVGAAAPTELWFAISTDGGSSFTKSVIDNTAIFPWNNGYSSIASPNGNTIFVSYNYFRIEPPIGGTCKIAYSTDNGTTWTIETVDTDSGYKTSLYTTSSTIFIAHSTWVSPWSLKLSKTTFLLTGLYFRSTGTNAGYYTKDSTSPSLLTSKDSNGMINAGGSPSPYLDHSSATDYYRKEF